MNASKNIYYLTYKDIKNICFKIAKKHYEFNEPIPDFETVSKDKLETILELPKQNVFGKELYSTIFEKAACYFFFIIKDHPFFNGNKRLAIVTTYVFLSINGIIFSAPWKEIYDFSIKLAKKADNAEELFKKTVEFIKKYSKKII